MKAKKEVKEVIYRHLTLSGTSYEIGKMEGEFLKKYHPEEVQFFLEGNDWFRPVTDASLQKAMDIFSKYCPYINEEIQGFAESLGVSAKQILYYGFSYVSTGNCSHFTVHPDRVADGHMYVGRSYEWNDEDDFRLITTKAEGVYAHIGFSLLLLGRFDGMNEHGLCVTMSNAVPMEQSEEEGLRFWMVIRILLDQCKTVEEAVGLIKELPISSYCNLIIADKNNHAVLAEICNSTKTFRAIKEGETHSVDVQESVRDTYVCSTNHYTLPGMEDCVKNKMNHSVYRYQAMIRGLEEKDILDRDDFMNILTKHTPEGLACHYYEEWLGTLWSMLFDITNLTIDICFGSSVVNKWYTFDLNTEPGVREYLGILPLEKADNIMWQRV
ncbi:C45 family autoproteolytic acyltransferase/hydolase [Anaeromicropila herbilytica]|uniref:Choloylglycine hydrolase n=1 Tax=Anaeromicropila herbilytica TaxID=2785025 RepID=A0A7R7IFA4_9FIRM|nr:C45 family peptidase [Anaeromicropila herbilytica]BCN31928.1 choloylglycine hydrolase [Anaeromicropila herbilytica]